MGMTDEDIEAFIRKDIEWEKAHRGGIVIGARLDDNITRPERVIAPPKMKGLLVDIGRCLKDEIDWHPYHQSDSVQCHDIIRINREVLL